MYKKMIYILLLSLLIVPFLTGKVHASQEDISVSYTGDGILQELQNGKLAGYGKELLDRLSRQLDWKVEYQKLSTEAEDSDLLFVEEREYVGYFYSQQEVGRKYYNLYARSDNNQIFYEDASAFRSMQVGLIKDNSSEKALDEYFEEKGMGINKKYYENITALKAALQSGEVDSAVFTLDDSESNCKVIANLREFPVYFASESQKVIQALDKGIEQLESKNPYFILKLLDKYYGTLINRYYSYTREEYEYVSDLAALTMVVDPGGKPVEYLEKGNYYGIYADILKEMSRLSGIQFKIVETPSFAASMEAVRNGEVNLISSVFDSAQMEKEYNIWITEPYISADCSMIGKKGMYFDEKQPLTIAVNSSYPGTFFWIKENYPYWDIQFYDNTSECIAAIQKGEADIAIQNQFFLDQFLQSESAGNTGKISILDANIQISMGISCNMPEVTRQVLNKAIGMLPPEYADYCILKNTLSVPYAVPVQVIWSYVVHFLVVTGLVLVIIFIFRIRRKNKVLLALAEADRLTGLYNKISFEQRVVECLREQKNSSHAVFTIDLDQFKMVNDTYGHDVGDILLIGVAQNLCAVFRQTDLVGRMGGDEFCVFMRDCVGEKECGLKCQIIMDVLSAIRTEELEGFRVTASIGVAMYPQDGQNLRDLMRASDQAMYRAKEKGRNCFQIYSQTKDGKEL